MAKRTAYAGLLRGINVGGHRKLPMADLRSIVTDAGGEQVATYIQSGNVVFTATTARARLVTDLESHIEERTGHDVTVVLRTAAELQAVVDANPFPDAVAEPTSLHVAFLQGRPDRSRIEALDLASFAPEEVALGRSEVYLHLPGGIGRSKLAVALSEKAMGSRATVRNWRSVTRVLDMVAALEV